MRQLSNQQKDLLYEILSKRAPEWLARWDDIEAGALSEEDILEILNTILADEIMESGFLPGGEPTQRGMQIEELIGWFSLQLP
ncbi:MAG: hypothetical protein K6U77_07005 [Armatimonadetes bacterium]|nr:hypothetical protein [Armatimonadota bacterium]